MRERSQKPEARSQKGTEAERRPLPDDIADAMLEFLERMQRAEVRSQKPEATRRA